MKKLYILLITLLLINIYGCTSQNVLSPAKPITIPYHAYVTDVNPINEDILVYGYSTGSRILGFSKNESHFSIQTQVNDNSIHFEINNKIIKLNYSFTYVIDDILFDVYKSDSEKSANDVTVKFRRDNGQLYSYNGNYYYSTNEADESKAKHRIKQFIEINKISTDGFTSSLEINENSNKRFKMTFTKMNGDYYTDEIFVIDVDVNGDIIKYEWIPFVYIKKDGISINDTEFEKAKKAALKELELYCKNSNCTFSDFKIIKSTLLYDAHEKRNIRYDVNINVEKEGFETRSFDFTIVVPLE